MVGVRVDITEQRAQRDAAEAATARLQDAIEALADGFALFDADDRLVVSNTRYRELYAASAPALAVGTSFEDILRYGLAHGQYPRAAGREAEWLAERLHVHRNPGPPQLQQLPGNRWLRIDERRTRDGGIAGVRTEVTELVRREQQLLDLNAQLDEALARLEQLSETDALTGIANRRHFDRRLAEEWSRLARHGTPFALLLVDVDHFKRYNDRHGHQEGDRCLHEVAQTLLACSRRPTDPVARCGGEEFAVLLPHTTRAAATMHAKRLMVAMDEACLSHGDSPVAPFVTLSVGGALAEPARSWLGPRRAAAAGGGCAGPDERPPLDRRSAFRVDPALPGDLNPRAGGGPGRPGTWGVLSTRRAWASRRRRARGAGRRRGRSGCANGDRLRRRSAWGRRHRPGR
jgi:diguanylate cyclase (GGDEF)-like protein